LDVEEATMSRAHARPTADESIPEPAWDVARLFPAQGHWSEDDYLALNSNHLVEFSHGMIEVLPMPSISHQRIVAYLYGALLAFVSARQLGEVLFAPLRVRLAPGKYREPDVVFKRTEDAQPMNDQYWTGADLVMEVVSDDRRLDLEIKRLEYARAGIPEYWMVDPKLGRITVLVLAGDSYTVHGEFAPGDRATSVLLEGFGVEVATVFAAKS